MTTSSKSKPHNSSKLPFRLETQLERAIAADPEWLAGLEWGRLRPGHPEGQVKFHIREVLSKIDHFYANSDHRARLRLIGLIHDTFKYKRKQRGSGVPQKPHGYWARQFAERYIDDGGVLAVIELHDEAYKAFRSMSQLGRQAAEAQAKKLINRLGQHLDLFIQFYRCDSRTGDKSRVHYEWFREIVARQDNP